MAEHNRVGAYQDFLHDQPEDLLADDDIHRVGAFAQFASKASEAFRQLEYLASSTASFGAVVEASPVLPDKP